MSLCCQTFSPDPFFLHPLSSHPLCSHSFLVLAQLTPEQEAEKLTRTIFVGNVPATMARKAIKELFTKCGGMCPDAQNHAFS